MKNILEKTKEVARTAGKEILRRYEENRNKVVIKENKTPVTEADLASEKIIVDGLKEFDYGILSEEMLGSSDRFDKKRVWIIDTLDGNSEFISRTGEFSIMVGLVENGEPILGVVYQPAKDEFYYATKGGGSYFEKKGVITKMEVSSRDNFQDFVMVASRNHLMPLDEKMFLSLKMKEMIKHGSVGPKVGLIGRGLADFYITPSPKTGEWDICASDIILSEAGGVVTDLNGDKLKYNKEQYLNLNGFVCSNGVLHEEIIAEIRNLRE